MSDFIQNIFISSSKLFKLINNIIFRTTLADIVMADGIFYF